jgi:hypothetical protein
VNGLIEVKMDLHSIRMNGHAGCSVDGQDIVCSAISALTCNLINSMQALTDNKIRAETDSGSTIIEWQELSEEGKLLVDSWFIGITAVNQEYNCIVFV